MSKRGYLTINNYSGLGTIGISRQAIEGIVSASLHEVPGATLFESGKKYSLNDAVRVVFAKDGRANIKMNVNIARGASVPSVCEEIQQSVADAINLMCDMVPFDVQVKVMRIV